MNNDFSKVFVVICTEII